MKKWAFIFLLAIIVSLPCSAQAQSPQQTLNQYVADLQKNPNDYALQEKIIKHVQAMKQKPAVPSEAEKFEGRAEFAIRSAKTEADFLDAAKEYEKALLIAPWVPAYYFNQGIAFEKAGKLKEAKRSFETYLLAAPNAQDARDVRKRIAGLEYAMEKAAKESSPQAVAAKKQQTYEEWLRSLDGSRFFGSYNVLNEYWESELTIRGSKLYWRTSCVRGRGCIAGWFVKCRGGAMQIVERQATCINEVAPASWNVVSDIFTVSEDGKSITHAQQTINGRTFTYYRQ